MTNPADMVDRIVAGVLERLQAPATAPGVVTATATAPVAAPAIRPAAPPAATANGALSIPDVVITAGLLETRGVLSGPVVFAAKAILTPSAVDFLKSRKIAWSKANNSQSGAAAASTSNVSWLALVSRSTPAIESALDALAKQPGIHWKRELVGCHRESARRAVAALCRGECDAAIAVTGKPESVVCRANRNAQVRAAAVDSLEQAKRAKRTLGANLFAVDPAEQSMFALRGLLREIVAGGKPVLPSDWSE
jgi:hypothetical protein